MFNTSIIKDILSFPKFNITIIPIKTKNKQLSIGIAKSGLEGELCSVRRMVFNNGDRIQPDWLS